jgi:hypothetical protein
MLQPTNGYLGLETLILLLLPKSRNTPLGGTLINILVTLYAVVQSGKQKEHKSSQSEVRVVILNFHSLRKVTLIFGSTGGLFLASGSAKHHFRTSTYNILRIGHRFKGEDSNIGIVCLLYHILTQDMFNFPYVINSECNKSYLTGCNNLVRIVHGGCNNVCHITWGVICILQDGCQKFGMKLSI